MNDNVRTGVSAGLTILAEMKDAMALYFMHYNFARPHKTLANPYPRTPAMAAGIADHIWTIEEIVRLADSH